MIAAASIRSRRTDEGWADRNQTSWFFSWTAYSRRLNRFLELDNHFAVGISYLTNSRLFDNGKSLILVPIGEWIASYHEMKRGSLKVADDIDAAPKPKPSIHFAKTWRSVLIFATIHSFAIIGFHFSDVQKNPGYKFSLNPFPHLRVLYCTPHSHSPSERTHCGQSSIAF